MTGSTKTITFRLDAEFAAELDRRAEERGVNRSEYVRQVMIANLTSDPALDTRNRLAELQDEMHKMRQEILTSVTAILVYGGKIEREQAESFVNSIML